MKRIDVAFRGVCRIGLMQTLFAVKVLGCSLILLHKLSWSVCYQTQRHFLLVFSPPSWWRYKHSSETKGSLTFIMKLPDSGGRPRSAAAAEFGHGVNTSCSERQNIQAAAPESFVCLWGKVSASISISTGPLPRTAGMLTSENKGMFANSGINSIQFIPPHVDQETDWICIQMGASLRLIRSRRPHRGSDITAPRPPADACGGPLPRASANTHTANEK